MIIPDAFILQKDKDSANRQHYQVLLNSTSNLGQQLESSLIFNQYMVCIIKNKR